MTEKHTFKIIVGARRGTHESLADVPMVVLRERLALVQAQKKQAIKGAYRLFGAGCTRLIAADLEAYNAQIDALGVEIDGRLDCLAQGGSVK